MSQCALNTAPRKNGLCINDEQASIIEEYSNKKISALIEECPPTTINECIIDGSNAPNEVKEQIKRESLKIPAEQLNSQYWLNNTEIDNVMSQMRLLYDGFAHSFIHMSDLKTYDPSNIDAFDYTVYPVTEIDFGNEFKYGLKQGELSSNSNDDFTPKLSTHNDAPLKSYGVIFNTDTSKGGGQHWFCIFISTDQKDPDHTNRPWIRIELFNSAGGGCSNPKFNEFWNITAAKIARTTGLKCTFDIVSNIQHQNNDTGNCGSYSLFYIYTRLNGCIPSDFDNPDKKITDNAMRNFRKVCFRIEK